METLAPRSAYPNDELGIVRNAPLFAGLFFGLFTGLVELVEVLVEGGTLGAALREALLELVLGGVIFGLLFGIFSLVTNPRRMNRVHAGDTRVVAPPPGALYRLPCGLARAPRRPRRALPGPWGMRFQPHPRTWKAYREALVMGPLEEIEIERADARLPFLMRLWGHSAPGFVVRWPEGRAELVLPETRETFGRLGDALASVRAGAPLAPEVA